MTIVSTLYAQPYDCSAQGFYFHTFEEYEEQTRNARNVCGQKVEEFLIEFIDGEDRGLLDACRIDQTNLSDWFERVVPLDDHEKVALFFLMDYGICSGLDDALDKTADVSIYQGPLIGAATELFDDCYADSIPDNLRFYIDYEAFARDCRLGGDMVEFTYQGEIYTCTNANGL